MSFGHDGYIAEVMKPWMPIEALYMLRFHSFYPWHRHGAYHHLANAQDRAMMQWGSNSTSTTSHKRPRQARPQEIKPYYDDLFAEFLPEKIAW